MARHKSKHLEDIQGAFFMPDNALVASGLLVRLPRLSSYNQKKWSPLRGLGQPVSGQNNL
jgi:hypothetical protein